jgi:hypothetical protein
MRNFVWVVALLGGCAAGTGGPRGGTYAEHRGHVPLVVTNATPQRMCELHMSFEDQASMGDNWLPSGGIASGKSLEFKVKPGKYQATWNTCQDGAKHYFAGTLIGDTGIDVGQQTQLFVYVADNVAPTKRAAVLTRDYKIVHFTGQPVGPVDYSAPPATAKVDAFAKVEASLGRGNAAPATAKAGEPKFEPFSAKDMIDPKAKRTAKRTKMKPALSRKHDIAQATVKYRTR